MSEARTVKLTYPARAALEGAGVRLKRGLGFAEMGRFDPFLLLDDIHSGDPVDYLAGFPWHPHRGIETVTYVLRGRIEHGDSLGNAGMIGAGGVQWMTAGRGIVHQEMPKRHDGDFRGLQLWINLPRDRKMSPPRYREVGSAAIPEVAAEGGARVRIVAGNLAGVEGPVRDTARTPEYFHVALPPGASFRHDTPERHTVFAYVLEGEVTFGGEGAQGAGWTALLGPGGSVEAASASGAEFLLFVGEPLGEPIAWRGPIVMNTEAELRTAFREYSEGTFIRRE